jgi:hypothetical protein
MEPMVALAVTGEFVREEEIITAMSAVIMISEEQTPVAMRRYAGHVLIIPGAGPEAQVVVRVVALVAVLKYRPLGL